MSLLKHRKRHHDRDARDGGHEEETLNGVVQAYNYSPKGGVEGMLIQEGDRTLQINLTPDIGLAIALAAGVGQSVEATVEPEPEAKKHPKGEHPVHRLVVLKATNGRMFASAGPGHGEAVTVEGVVSRLNYAKHGEANGVVLESGDFLHLKPDGMKRAGLQVGQQIRAEGRARPTPLGQRAIEAEIVNGLSLGSKKPPR
ncbi:hypothetical protein SAMN05444166_1901 [Singulisphaera sp. GP187]|uniref:hypothetical protein n=1 Tax=Singulisphaera sp. GP187 TaxID=1882752 RepID=UPI00092BCBFE|nr:hypothetical protein [Singulisphaera sp. GP187]SIN98282.1 hypothetical protein SAMN05444166_1901 [Singulisphaera sp. GP187]